MTGIVFLRDGMILISSLIVRLLLIVFSLVRYIVKRFSKIMLMVCVLSILLVNTGQDGMNTYRLKMAAAGMIFILLSFASDWIMVGLGMLDEKLSY